MLLTLHKKNRPITRHVLEKHGGKIEVLQFWVLEQFKFGPRKGDLDKHLLKLEVRWIFRLNSLAPSGLNEGLYISTF